jgi:SAM-dependent methyltransferase
MLRRPSLPATITTDASPNQSRRKFFPVLPRWLKVKRRAVAPSPEALRGAFSFIYENDLWGRGSGAGSFPEYTQPYVAMLQRFLRDHEIRSVVDVGCGDWQFSRLIDWDGVDYLGLDLVESVIEANRKAFATNSIAFEVATVGEPLPSADLVVCKDVLQHLPLAVVGDYLAQFRQRFKHVLVTNDVYPDASTNDECPLGSGRALRPDLEPFSQECTLVLEWEISTSEQYWIKHTYHLSGEAGPDAMPPAVEPVLLRRAEARDSSERAE